jgi:hypothetical protein
MVYGLKDKKYFQFNCIAKTEREMEEKIDSAYGCWRGLQSRGATEESRSKEVFLERYIKVKITIERIK